MPKERNYRHGVVVIARGLTWFIVSTWIVVTTVIALVRNAPITEYLFTVLLGAFVLFVAGGIVTSICVNFIVTSVQSLRQKKRKALIEEFQSLIAAGGRESNDSSQDAGGKASGEPSGVKKR
jgi:hypothetical protein